MSLAADPSLLRNEMILLNAAVVIAVIESV
jgi:hypothetical protein